MGVGSIVAHGINPDALDQPNRGQDEPQDERTEQNLLDLARSEDPADQAKAAKQIQKLWRDASNTGAHRKREAQWKANRLRRLGVPNVRIQKNEDQGIYTVYAPPGVQAALPMVNMAATLCRKMTANLFADPPAPEPVPASGEDSDRDAADFAERALIDLQSESNLNTVQKARRAFDRGHDYGSGFEWFYVDPQGGGRQPMAIWASPDAPTADEALQGRQPYVIRYLTAEQDYTPPPEQLPMIGPDGLPVVDPMTGQPAMEAVPQPSRRTRLLVDDPNKADRHWVPKLRSEVLTGRHLRFLPATADDLWDATGVLKGAFLSWGEAKKLFPPLADLSEEQQSKLLKYEPDRADALLPAGLKSTDDLKGDERLVWLVTCVWKESPTYENGAYLVAAGDEVIGYAGDWAPVVDGQRLALDLPVTQYAQWDEGRDDPYKVGTMEIIGPGNEARAAQIGSLLTHLDRFNNRKVFLPTNSILQPKQLQLATGTAISINPGGKPEYEEIPNYPKESVDLFGILTDEMGNSISLAEIAQGLESKDVESGRHAYQIVAQAHAGLSEPKQNVERGYERGCRVMLQLVRAFYDKLQRLRWATEDGQYKERFWQGSDLGSTTDVRIKPGTMTMLSPVAKMQLAETWGQAGLLAKEQLQDVLFSGVGATIGVRDEPVRLRVRQQVSLWEQGPPEGMPPEQMTPQAMAIWEPVEADMLPQIAAIRLYELAKLQSRTKYRRWPMEWRVPVIQEFQRMQLATQPPPPMATGGEPAQAPPTPEAAAVPGPTIDPSQPPLDNPVLT